MGTTSAILTFAIELTEKSKTYYHQAQEATVESKFHEVLQSMLKRQSKLVKRLQRFRRELVTEMILEPIHGFIREDFNIELQLASEQSISVIVSTLLDNEQNMRNYLRMASEKLAFLPELSNQFLLLTEDVETNIQALRRFAQT
ncbi:MAG: hypothetical protein ACFFBR_03005 [Promethearchaeota archaeon]